MHFDFSVRDHIEFMKGKEIYDLHNDYDFQNLTYDLSNAILLWRRSNEDKFIKLIFYDIDIAQIMVKPENVGRELGVFGHAGFVCVEDEFFQNRLIEFGDQDPESCFLLGFEGGELRFRSRRASLEKC